MLDVFVCASGMLRRWDDSQKYLSDNPHLVCDETANCLVVICIDFEIDEVSAVRYVCNKFIIMNCLSGAWSRRFRMLLI